MGRFIDRTGERVGRLTLIERAPNRGPRARWKCRCDCGFQTTVLASSLGRSTWSCGCLSTDRRREKGRNGTHKLSKTHEHKVWVSMRRRCLNPNDQAYPRYGGRGICLCERWNSFQAFLADMGLAPEGFEIERIDNDGDYCPENCRWASIEDQANNKRNNRMVPLPSGELGTVAQYAQLHGVKYATAYYRTVLHGRAPRRDKLSRSDE